MVETGISSQAAGSAVSSIANTAPHSMDMAGPRLGTTGVTIIPHSGNAENHHADHIDDPMMQRARQ